MSRIRPCWWLVVLCLWCRTAQAQPSRPPSSPTFELSLSQTIALARKQAPELGIAHAHVLESRARVDEADVARFSPQFTARLGPRWQDDGVALDWSIRGQHWLELGRQRHRRVDVARVGVRVSEARRDNRLRTLLREVSLTFVLVAYWHQRRTIAGQSLGIADSTLAIARRKHNLGAVGGLELALAELGVARARAQRDRVGAAVTTAENRLIELIGLPSGTELRLTESLAALARGEVPEGPRRPRPDVEAARAELRQTEAEAQLAQRGRIPNLALGLGYGREGDEHVVLGSLSLSLPNLARQRAKLRAVKAKQSRLHAEIATLTRSTELRQRATQERLVQLNATTEQFATGGLVQLQRAATLAEASYRSGAMTLGELLHIRRSLNEARLEYVELLLETATARRELAAERGAF